MLLLAALGGGALVLRSQRGGSGGGTVSVADAPTPSASAVPDTSVGHELEVRVLAADCGNNAHAGYVYVDAFGSLAIPPQGQCLNGLNARGKPGKVQLTWPDNGSAGYRVYRSESFVGPYISLGQTTSRHSTWLDDAVVAGREYFYSVRPLDAAGVETCTSGQVIGIAPPHWQPGQALNRPPYFTSAPIVVGDIAHPYTYAPTVLDADGDTLTYRLLVAAQGMAI